MQFTVVEIIHGIVRHNAPPLVFSVPMKLLGMNKMVNRIKFSEKDPRLKYALRNFFPEYVFLFNINGMLHGNMATRIVYPDTLDQTMTKIIKEFMRLHCSFNATLKELKLPNFIKNMSSQLGKTLQEQIRFVSRYMTADRPLIESLLHKNELTIRYEKTTDSVNYDLLTYVNSRTTK